MPSTTARSCSGVVSYPTPDHGVKPELVARGERLEADVRDLTVRDADDGAIDRADPCRAQADVVDGPSTSPILRESPTRTA